MATTRWPSSSSLGGRRRGRRSGGPRRWSERSRRRPRPTDRAASAMPSCRRRPAGLGAPRRRCHRRGGPCATRRDRPRDPRAADQPRPGASCASRTCPRLLRGYTFMGGAFGAPGNTTPTTEWNIHCDPHAAKRVFRPLGDRAGRRPAIPRPSPWGSMSPSAADHARRHGPIARRAGSRRTTRIALAHGEDPMQRAVRWPAIRSSATSPTPCACTSSSTPATTASTARSSTIRWPSRPRHGSVAHRDRSRCSSTSRRPGAHDGDDRRGLAHLHGKPPNVDVAVRADVDGFMDRLVERVGGLAARSFGRGDASRPWTSTGSRSAPRATTTVRARAPARLSRGARGRRRRALHAARRSRDLSTAVLALMPVAIAINIAIGSLVVALELPIYLDSIGTILVGVLAGPWAGALTGLLSNLIWSILPSPAGPGPVIAFFAPVAAVIGLIAGFWASRGVFQLGPDDARRRGFLSLAFGVRRDGHRLAASSINTVGLSLRRADDPDSQNRSCASSSSSSVSTIAAMASRGDPADRLPARGPARARPALPRRRLGDLRRRPGVRRRAARCSAPNGWFSTARRRHRGRPADPFLLLGTTDLTGLAVPDPAGLVLALGIGVAGRLARLALGEPR